MLRTGLALIHKGETLIPAGGGMGGFTFINNGPVVGTSPQNLGPCLGRSRIP